MQPVQDNPDDNADAKMFAAVASGVYRRVDAKSVFMALRYAVGQQLFSENPAIMLMFVRIAEVHQAVFDSLKSQQSKLSGPLRQAVDLVLEPPLEIRDAKYLPDSIQSPGEMDLCWAEFLVTGQTDVVQKIIDVLDRDDRTRDFLKQLLSEDTKRLPFSDSEQLELQQVGIGLGKLSADSEWEVMTPGDTDIFLWLGIKDSNQACVRVFEKMDDDLKLHLANKGAALWSLQANASQHGSVRLLCDAAASQSGGFGRQLLQQP